MRRASRPWSRSRTARCPETCRRAPRPSPRSCAKDHAYAARRCRHRSVAVAAGCARRARAPPAGWRIVWRRHAVTVRAGPAGGKVIHGVQIYRAQWPPRMLARPAHEIVRAYGPLADHPAAAAVSAGFLSHSVRLRPQDQPGRDGRPRPALHRHADPHAGRSPAACVEPGELPLPLHR